MMRLTWQCLVNAAISVIIICEADGEYFLVFYCLFQTIPDLTSFLFVFPVPVQHYTVYPANSQFSRKTPDPPKFIVSVYPGGHPPPVEMLAAADGACGGVPIRYASVEYGDIALYAMARAELPTINHMWQLHQKVANGG
jgi:hypothetical protein